MRKPGKNFSVEIGIGDTRQSDRLQVVDLLASVGKRCSGEVVDISETGLGVRYNGTKRYEIGDCLGMALRRHDVLLLVRAEVKWVRQPKFNEHIAGFAFVDLKPEQLETVRELLSQPDKAANVSKTA